MNKKEILNTTSSLVLMADSLTELDLLLEKLTILSQDLSFNYLDKIDINTQRGKLTAEYDLNIARVKSDVIYDYALHSKELTENLLELSKISLASIQSQTN